MTRPHSPEERALIIALGTFNEVRSVLSDKVDAARAALLVVGCSHPADHVKGYRWEYDNGYGRQHYNTGSRCDLCFALDPYQTGAWIKPEEFVRGDS